MFGGPVERVGGKWSVRGTSGVCRGRVKCVGACGELK